MKTRPSLNELLSEYPRIAAAERLKNERPCASTVRNVVTGVWHICHALGLTGEESCTALSRQKLDMYLAEAKARNHTATTAWTYVGHLRALTARWTLPYYEDREWEVPPFQLPVCRRKPARYIRPDRELLLRVRDWYETLLQRRDVRDWLAVTLMLEFAMRNGDVGRLRWADFRVRPATPYEQGGSRVVLCYTPRKTSLTSGRIVAWPVHPEIWRQICSAREKMGTREGTHFQGLVVPASRMVFERLNKELRDRHFFHGSKALYELRKICVDHIYQRFGAEMASSISGDDIKTVTRYYADPSAVNVEGVRIVDLL